VIVLQAPMAIGHRECRKQPEGKSMGLGISPRKE
jgi:hypothetical protein